METKGELTMNEQEKKELVKLREAEFLRSCRDTGLTPGLAKAIVQSDFNDLTSYRKWKKRLKG